MLALMHVQKADRGVIPVAHICQGRRRNGYIGNLSALLRRGAELALPDVNVNGDAGSTTTGQGGLPFAFRALT